MGLLSLLVVKCVRRTTSLAVTMDLALGQVILVLVVSCLVGGGSSETLKVSSTGAAATKQGDKMGDYMLTNRTQNGHRVYEKTNGYTNFLYVSSNGFGQLEVCLGLPYLESTTPSRQLPPCHQPAGGVTWTGRNGKRMLPSRLNVKQPHQQVSLQWIKVFSDVIFFNVNFLNVNFLNVKL